MTARLPSSDKRRFIVPEVVQSSAMDCGPAALKAVLGGYGIEASYGRLREACQTAVDGTSIDTLEELAVDLGLDAEQIMVPVDHLLFPEARTLPAIVVTAAPNGSTHFVVVWRRHGGFLQVMDPTIGRRWVRAKDFLAEVYVHEFRVDAGDWREWAGSDEFLGGLTRRLEQLGIAKNEGAQRIEEALEDPGWHSIARLDALVRMVDALVEAGAIARGKEALAVLDSTVEQAVADDYWSVRPVKRPGAEAGENEGGEQLILRGALLIRATGLRAEDGGEGGEEKLPEEVEAVISTADSKPGSQLLELLGKDGFLTPGILLGAVALAAGGVLIEALLFRSLIDMGTELATAGQRLGGLVAILVLGICLLLLDVPSSLGLWRLGRRLEMRLRMAFLDKLPRLGDRYFGSRLSSDMAERSHSIHQIRNIGTLVGSLAASFFELLFVTAGIAWLDPPSAPFAVLAAAGAVLVPGLAHRGLAERDLRLRSHSGALSRFYLDAMLGLMPIRAHTAEDTVRREHESLLSEWARAGLRLHGRTVSMLGWQLLVGFGLALTVVLSHLGRAGADSMSLLLVYWALSIPVLGQEIAVLWSRYPWQRNVTLRLLEPLGARESESGSTVGVGSAAGEAVAATSGAVAIALRGVRVVAGGHALLEDVSTLIPAGSHVAIVGPSGAGKSTLVGLLLGWHEAAVGTVEVDERPLTPAALTALRQRTAWVDPAVRLWNRSLMENLNYGDGDERNLGFVIERALLEEVLKGLPEGLQTVLGEGGALVSGGEGQRVRVARGMMRRDAGLVILDEPFRGLQRDTRTLLMRRARELWERSTMLYVTHDARHALSFDRVLVVDHGRLVEQGPPEDLAQMPDSRFRRLVQMEAEVSGGLWANPGWRRLWLQDRRLRDLDTEDGAA